MRSCFNIALSILLSFAYIFLYRAYEKRQITELSLKSFPRYAWWGFAIGFFIQSLVIAILFICGSYKITGINSPAVMLLPFFSGIFTGVFEEILFRGVIFRLLEEKLGTIIALVISALLFGFAHAGNPGATITSSVAIALEAGVLLGVCYVLTRNLWFPIFLHMAWNFTQGGIWGAHVSGSSGEGLFQSEITGPEWLTGGAFGPEAAYHTVAICLIVAIWMYIKAQKKGQIIKPFWRRSNQDTPDSVQ